MAEKAGFGAVNSSDHFFPWSVRQGQSGFSFAWLGAAMQATTIPFGMVCAPGPRYHPAVIAQAVATLCQLFPGRFWLTLGSGEALNERITGELWPDKDIRNQQLFEAHGIIKRLLKGERVSHKGAVWAKDAQLYTLPGSVPFISTAAVTEKTAGWLGTWADGLTTIHKPYEELKATVGAFEKGGGKGKPKYLKVQLSYSRTYGEALEGAYDQWRTNVLPYEHLDDYSLPEEFDKAAENITREEVAKMVHISTDPKELVEWIRQYADMGFESIILHNVNREQELFIEDFGNYVLPELKKSAV